MSESSKPGPQHEYEQMFNPDEEECMCDWKTCALGIASIAMGIGGLALALII